MCVRILGLCGANFLAENLGAKTDESSEKKFCGKTAKKRKKVFILLNKGNIIGKELFKPAPS